MDWFWLNFFDVQNDTSCNVAEERTKQVSPGRSFTNNISQPSQNPCKKVSLRSQKTYSDWSIYHNHKYWLKFPLVMRWDTHRRVYISPDRPVRGSPWALTSRAWTSRQKFFAHCSISCCIRVTLSSLLLVDTSWYSCTFCLPTTSGPVASLTRPNWD